MTEAWAAHWKADKGDVLDLQLMSFTEEGAVANLRQLVGKDRAAFFVANGTVRIARVRIEECKE
jgi:hypothetical protein